VWFVARFIFWLSEGGGIVGLANLSRGSAMDVLCLKIGVCKEFTVVKLSGKWKPQSQWAKIQFKYLYTLLF